ncbi:MAG: hypothetical protein ACRD0M_07665, partial [Acidimicrobiales bacterium]
MTTARLLSASPAGRGPACTLVAFVAVFVASAVFVAVGYPSWMWFPLVIAFFGSPVGAAVALF